MLTAICCIAKCENRYLEEWVDYHLSLGFSRIFINDNNSNDGEQILPSVSNNDLVTIIDCRGKKAYQDTAYTEFYKKYGKDYDWIAFIDLDEFITFTEGSGLHTIDQFLSRFDSHVDIVHLNWMCYGDNGIVDYGDEFSVLRRFTKPLDFDIKAQYDFPENNHVKSIIRGGLDIGKSLITPHTLKGDGFKVSGADGTICSNEDFKPYEFSIAYVRHYITKTIYEWLLKISRGLATMNAVSELYSIDRFFWYNEMTAQKQQIIQNYQLFREAAKLSVETELAACREELVKVKRENEKIKKEYSNILTSKAYKLGHVLLDPLKKVRKRISK